MLHEHIFVKNVEKKIVERRPENEFLIVCWLRRSWGVETNLARTGLGVKTAQSLRYAHLWTSLLRIKAIILSRMACTQGSIESKISTSSYHTRTSR